MAELAFFDPRPPAPRAAAAPAPRLDPDARAPRIGLLANGFPDSARFLDHLRDGLHARFPGATFVAVTKASPPTPLTEGQLHTLTHECAAVVAAYGH